MSCMAPDSVRKVSFLLPCLFYLKVFRITIVKLSKSLYLSNHLSKKHIKVLIQTSGLCEGSLEIYFEMLEGKSFSHYFVVWLTVA